MPLLHLPPRARLIYIPGDDRPSHEFVLRRRLLMILLGVVALLALLVVTFLSTYAVLVLRSAQVSRLQRELRDASDQLERVRELNKELDQMRRMQDQVLTMLGVTSTAPTGAATPGSPANASPGAARLPDEPARRPAGAAAGPGVGLIAAPPPDCWPVSGYVTREFTVGDREGRGAHAALDIVAPLETPLKAAGKGIVTAAGWDNFLGNYVEITHGLGYVTVYGHCSRLSVKEGDRVDRAQQIGYLGGTGQASAPHLHFEVWKDGTIIDPRLVIPGDPPR